jgi:hypothetical protein
MAVRWGAIRGCSVMTVTSTWCGQNPASDRGTEHGNRVGAPVGGIPVGEHLPDIAGVDRTEHRIGYRVRDRVAIRVTVEMDVGWDVHASQHERTPGGEPVRVVPYADAQAINE